MQRSPTDSPSSNKISSSKIRRALELVAEVAEKDADELDRGQDLVADLGVDSPKALKLLMDLEDLLGTEISDEDAGGLETVGDVLDLVAAASDSADSAATG